MSRLPQNLSAGITTADKLPGAAPAPAPQGEPAGEDIPLEVHAHGLLPTGLDVTLIYRGTAKQLGKVLRQIDRAGLVAPPRDFARTAEGLPICPRHDVAMRLREKQGDSWYSHIVKGPRGEELWCRGHAGPESPGFDAPAGGGSS